MFGKNKNIIEVCSVCGHTFKRSTGKKIITKIGFYYDFGKTEKWFCSQHIPKYDRLVVSATFEDHRIYFREFQVNEDGTPIGYQPIPPSSPNKKK